MPPCRRRWSTIRSLLLASCISFALMLVGLHLTHPKKAPEMETKERPSPEELRAAPENLPKTPEKSPTSRTAEGSPDVHAFYYPWYGDPDHDGAWLHWNHEFLPHWDPSTDAKFPKGRHHPPDDVGSNFYPELGPYSSKNATVIDAHMRQMRDAGIGVVVVSWYPPGHADSQGKAWDSLVPALLEAASRHGMLVTFHIEPFDNRSSKTLFEAIKYIISSYGHHSAFYRRTRRGKRLPLFYFYDSYQVNKNEWLKLFSGESSIRNTVYDCVAIGLVVNVQHIRSVAEAKFDGFYTYFASNGFSYGSSWKNWRHLASEARKLGLMFIPSVGPGYVDTRVRLWNVANTKERDGGKYYERSWTYARHCDPDIVSITSFNEWHEGTQIEPAVPKKSKLIENGSDYKYCDYQPENPSFYLTLTRRFVDEWLSDRASYRRRVVQ